MNTSTRRLTRHVIHPVVLALGAALLLAGCASTKDAKSRSNIANLKTAHLAFIDEFTEGAGKTWDDQKLATSTAALEKQFSDAEQAPATKADARRSKAISILHSRFKKHAATLERRKAFFKKTYAEDLKEVLSKNYDLALKGEDIRS
jgi:type IV pilus biogenesis protein CpaD/CtpE